MTAVQLGEHSGTLAQCRVPEGIFDVVVPHLTVSETPIELDLALPISARARGVTLIEEGADLRWASRQTFPLR